jgi:hypothetical protein
MGLGSTWQESKELRIRDGWGDGGDIDVDRLEKGRDKEAVVTGFPFDGLNDCRVKKTNRDRDRKTRRTFG